MATAVADDGYRLWYEATGSGPAIIFPARFRAEQAALGAALAGGHRVVRYKPRQVVGLLEPEEESGGPWEPATWSRFPVEMELADLHTVADAAGVGEFVLAGYSGMGALAGFLAAVSDRAAGLMVGGFPLLSGCDYWLGYVEGARAGLLQAGLAAKADEHHMGVLMYREWAGRDDTDALRALTGPKILWYGARDGEEECRMRDVLGGAVIARRVRETTGDLRAAGFEVIELDGLDHIAGLSTTGVVAPRLSEALASAGW